MLLVHKHVRSALGVLRIDTVYNFQAIRQGAYQDHIKCNVGIRYVRNWIEALSWSATVVITAASGFAHARVEKEHELIFRSAASFNSILGAHSRGFNFS